MKVRIGGVIVVAVATLRVLGGCSSDNSAANADAGGDVLPVTLGTGGMVDAQPDVAADAGVDRSSSGSGGAPGSGGTGVGGAGIGGAGIGGALGMGGAVGVGGALGTGGTPDAGGDTGVDGAAAGGAPGTGGAAVADAGSGGNDGGGGATSQIDGSVASDGPIDASAATLNQIWSTILSVVTPAQTSPGCINCHDGSDSSIPDYRSTATTYATWVGVPSTSCAGIRVTAGNAETSVLVSKLRAKPNLGLGVAVCGGDPMPVGTNRSITLDQLHLIENWINAGALNN